MGQGVPGSPRAVLSGGGCSVCWSVGCRSTGLTCSFFPGDSAGGPGAPALVRLPRGPAYLPVACRANLGLQAPGLLRSGVGDATTGSGGEAALRAAGHGQVGGQRSAHTQEGSLVELAMTRHVLALAPTP